jgi:hypothetical protein
MDQMLINISRDTKLNAFVIQLHIKVCAFTKARIPDQHFNEVFPFINTSWIE